MDGSLRDYPGSPQTIVEPAVMAAVDMVPDNGPWIIHMDLHPANVLYKVEGDHVRTALADWGRALHIEKPNDIASVRKGIMQWMNSDGDFEGQPMTAYRDALGELDWSVAPHMAALLTDPVVGMEEHLAAIRGWSLDYLLRRLDIEVGDTLLTAPNQAELRKRCLALTGGFSDGGKAMVKTRRGGAVWKEGADTCVFKPAVRCIGEPNRRQGVSRMVNANLAGTPELRAQEAIVALGINKGVVVYSQTCAPSYNANDLAGAPGFRARNGMGCSKLQPPPVIVGNQPAHLNMITEEWHAPLEDYFNPADYNLALIRKRDWRNVLYHAIEAAIELVRDQGPLIIHTDCHFYNIMVRYAPDGIEAGLSDWGRTLIIERDPLSEIYAWVVNLNLFYTAAGPLVPGANYENVANALQMFVDREPEFPQTPKIILRQLSNYFRNPAAQHVATINAIRGWVPYVILKQLQEELGGAEQFYVGAVGYLDPIILLRQPSQADLIATVASFFNSFASLESYEGWRRTYGDASVEDLHAQWNNNRKMQRMNADHGVIPGAPPRVLPAAPAAPAARPPGALPLLPALGRAVRWGRGGAMWRQGADTCVFKPAVKCSDKEEPTPGHVSRILNRKDATTDVGVEEALRTNHPDIVRMKLVSVHARSCTPHYTESDTAAWKGDEGGCTRLGAINDATAKNHINLITPEMEGTLDSYFNKKPAPGAKDERAIRKSNWRNIILGAISAAIELVPDDKEWIVHGDCHFGNVLLWRSPERSWPISALADWGRSMVIKDPNDLASVKAGIRQYAVSSGWIDQGEGDDVDVARVLGQMMGEGYDQLPDAVMQSLGNLMLMEADDEDDGFKRRLARIRGWVPYVLVKQALPAGDQLIDRATGVAININDLLTRPNQTELANLVTRILTSLPSPGDEGDELEPIPGALAEPVAPAAAPVAGPVVAPAAFPPMVPAAGPREGGMYWPTKYSRGLTRRQNAQRKRSATRRTKMSWTDPKAYVAFKSDKGVKTRRSSYTQRFHKKYPEAKTLPEIAKATGVSKAVLEKVYDRGMAAWRTGHRPGASQQAWGMARVHSFVLKGKTYRTADKDLA